MSDRMTPIPFAELMNWILTEKEKHDSVFGVQTPFKAKADQLLDLFHEHLETPFGPAAGPHTQLAQNIIAAYYAGSRFFELKTVQKMDGAELAACINRPCILADDEGYNCEWSTELYVPQAMGEYIKAWFILHVIAKEFDLGAQDGFQFNMSCGYNLEGIKDYVADSGEGRWTVQTAMDFDVPAHVITASLFTRFESRQETSYAMKLLAAMRNQFGGKKKKKD